MWCLCMVLTQISDKLKSIIALQTILIPTVLVEQNIQIAFDYVYKVLACVYMFLGIYALTLQTFRAKNCCHKNAHNTGY